jgi:hypothetical protein
MCEGSICAGDFDAALTYDLCSAEDRDRRCEVDIRVRNWWLTRSMKDCSSCLGDDIVIVVPRPSAGPSGYMGDVDVDRSFVLKTPPTRS